jgi:hypothetical protein
LRGGFFVVESVVIVTRQAVDTGRAGAVAADNEQIVRGKTVLLFSGAVFLRLIAFALIIPNILIYLRAV